MFVDLTGDRRKAVVVVGAGLGVLLVLGLVTMLFGMLTSSPVPLPGWPETIQRGADVAPAPEPTAPLSPTTRPKTTTAPETTAPAAEPTRTTGPGNGNGNGHGRPSKTPGKP